MKNIHPIKKETRKEGSGVARGDRVVLFILLSLCLLGLIMVYSASSALAWKNYADSTYFLKRQLLWTLIGIAAFFFMAQTDYHQFREGIIPISGIIFTLLCCVYFFGVDVNGARRWMRIGPISFQPSEFAKLFTVIYLAHYIAKKGDHLAKFFRGLWPVLLILGMLSFLIWMEPDLGTTLTIAIMTVILLFIGGASLRHLAWLSALAVPFVTYSLIRFPYMLQRVKTYINPLSDPPAKSFQINQSYIALGSGGTFGVGLGEGQQKLFFLPQPHTDFIFSVIGEELGFIGTFCVIVLFLSLLWKGARIAQGIEEPFGQILAIGTTLLIVMPALMNMGVVTGLLPTKGLSLAFISYGGSSLLMNWAAAEILYRVSKDIPVRRSGKKAKILHIEGADS
ncbi:MAG: putative lipid II flippase FtsW [Nitrospirae bacterium]|nr:putative lipid II flippase FtsW [Candidatus Troglogloeales bacterium]